MTSNKQHTHASRDARTAGGHSGGRSESTSDEQDLPEWTHGLRQLYDSVVDEPLPDSFNDILARFDENAVEEPDNSGDTAGESGE